MSKHFEQHCHALGLTQVDTDLAVDEAITRGRQIYGWNAEQSEIFDRDCAHGYEPTMTEDGLVSMCIHCGSIR
jgi:hypothetical protein